MFSVRSFPHQQANAMLEPARIQRDRASVKDGVEFYDVSLSL
jgi:hypothetical protein